MILQTQADHIAALNLLGIIKAKTGHLDAAAILLKRLTVAAPYNATAHNNYANVLKDLNHLAEATMCYDRALQLDPAYADAYNNRGGALYAMGDFPSALSSYDQAITHRPDFAAAHYNRGVTLQALNRIEEAVASFARALSLRPAFADALYNQGIALQQLRRLDDALRSYDRALEIAPDFAQAHCNRGNALQGLGRYQEAVRSYEAALRFHPRLAEAYSNQGNALAQLGRIEEAQDAYQCALRLDPDIKWICGALLRTKQQLCAWVDIDALVAGVVAGVEAARKVTQPFTLFAVSDSVTVQRRAAEIFADEQELMVRPLPPFVKRRRPRLIHLGYYSADFHNHATAQLIAGMIELHDRANFLVSAFSFGTNKPDEMTLRLQHAFDRYVDISSRSDREAAQLSRDLEIDIAIDLKGFTADSRAGIFAHRAAPLQVAYLGYPGTMGARYMDYIVADPTVIPYESRHQYTEKVIYLPHCYQVNDHKRAAITADHSRSEFGLPATGLVFCCFNACYKITAATFAGWMRILQAVEGSILWLLTDNAAAAENLRREAEAQGISGTRLVFARPLPLSQHLARYGLVDLFLDTFPCGAHTTASDALWCGVPVVTRMGESFVARVAASILRAVDLPDMVTTSQEDYEARAVELALAPGRLAAIRSRLADNKPRAPLFDTRLCTRHLEMGYRQIYERYHSDLGVDHIQVSVN